MSQDDASKLRYLLLGFFVTMLWSSSFVIIKLTLSATTPLVFAGYRYLVASLVLSAIVGLSPKYRTRLRQISRRQGFLLLVYGLVFIFFTQGFGYLTLSKLPAVTLSFALNFTTILVVVLGYFFLKEQVTPGQLLFVLLALVGGLVYFFPLDLGSPEAIGYLFVTLALLSNVTSTIMGRFINRDPLFDPILVTAVSMALGSVLLLGVGFITEGYSPLSSEILGSVLWLGLVNTALAFSLWNITLQHIDALEASLILNTILPQIAILSIIFLDEVPLLKEWIGMGIIIMSVTTVQVLGIRKTRTAP